ncbi:MAG TPA: rhodanese-like domain-containing protein [Acidimicrobiia bacterium]|nr:rhodanese-like domain-containing protein [Acidimicrobiia bacterium]HZQ80039.1 rhodanese-like domain-containing protein [Acidimicrobiia bacterium]
MATPKSFQQIVLEALRSVPEVTAPDLQSRLQNGEQIVVIDVREPDEFARGKIPGAYTIPRGVLEMQVDGRLPLDSTVVLYCGGGARSALACKSLADMGYDKVENLQGGWQAWVNSRLPVEQP